MPSVENQEVQFRDSKDSLRIMLAQISPAYDAAVLADEGIVKVRNGEKQAEKILKLIDYAISVEIDVLLFPELTAPFSHLKAFEAALRKSDRDLVVNICYEHTLMRDLIAVLSEEEMEEHGLLRSSEERKLVNFCRILIKVGHETKVFTQMKLTPFSSEFSLSAKDTLFCGKILHKFITNWGSFLFLICKDYVGEVRADRRIPMFDFLKTLTEDGLHYVFVSALNTEPEAFIHAARAFYYLQEKSGHTFSLFLNTAELDNTAVVFPVRPHPRIRTAGEVEMVPLFQGKPGWGTQLKFLGCKERLITGTFVRLDRYQPMPTKEIFSPIFQTDVVDLPELGIESELLISEEAAEVKKRIPRGPRHNLPSQTTPFLGREEELNEIATAIENPSCRLLTLVGPGGIGKTRLALQAAHERIEDFREGVYFVPLAPLSSTDFLVSTIANSLGFSFHGREDPKIQLLSYLREKEMLLVMDNFEHLLEGAELVRELLQSACRVKILATSRERLNLTGEWISEVQGMTFPEGEIADEAEGYSVVQLFVQSAQRVRPDFSLSEDEKVHVVRICRLVEGMPLGIELAAAWTRVLSCEDIGKEIEQNIDFLATSVRDVPERHRSVRAVFEHSWNLLPDEERQVFMRMSVFRGGFRREAADRVAGASLLLLSALVDKSLICWNPSEQYEIHELLRQYAEEKLSEVSKEREKTRDRHCEYYSEFLHQREEYLRGQREKEVLEEIAREIENVRTAWNWAVERQNTDAIARSIESVFRLYLIRGWFREGEEVFERAVERLTELGQAQGKAGAEEILGKILGREGVFWAILSDYERARDCFERGIAVFRRLDVPKERAFCFRNLGFVVHKLGKYEEAKRLLRDSLSTCTEIDDREGVATTLNTLGLVAYELGDYEEAKRWYQESVSIRRELGDRQGMAKALINRGNVAHTLGEYEEAKRLYEESLSISDETGDQWGMASSFNNLGNVAYQMGDSEEAKKLYEKSLAMKRQIGNRQGIASSLGNLGNISHELKQYEEARQLHQEMLTICRDIGNRRGTANALNGLGRASCALGEFAESREYFQEGLSAAMEINAAPVAIDILVGMAALMVKTGESEHALQLVGFALEHETAYKDTKERAERLRAEIGVELSPQVVSAWEERGRVESLDEIAKMVLGGERNRTAHTA